MDPNAASAAVDPVRGRFRRRRRRRERRGRPRGFYLLPHLVTTAGLFFGFYAIVQAFTGAPDRAALGIVLAGVCDALDGRLARMARSTSRFGLEYDSIADIVSSGVAPAALAYSAGGLHGLGRVGLVMAFLYVVGAALRLARFNVTPSRFRGCFEGCRAPPRPAWGAHDNGSTEHAQHQEVDGKRPVIQRRFILHGMRCP